MAGPDGGGQAEERADNPGGGDERLDRLYRSNRKPILRWLRSKGASQAHAEDLFHEAFALCLARAFQEMEDPSCYLWTVIEGLLIDEWRRQEVREEVAPLLATELTGQEPSPSDVLHEKECRKRIGALIDRLPLRQRQVCRRALAEWSVPRDGA